MAFHFTTGTSEEIISVNEAAVMRNTKTATKFGLRAFNGKLFDLSNHILKGESYRKLSSTIKVKHKKSNVLQYDFKTRKKH